MSPRSRSTRRPTSSMPNDQPDHHGRPTITIRPDAGPIAYNAPFSVSYTERLGDRAAVLARPCRPRTPSTWRAVDRPLRAPSGPRAPGSVELNLTGPRTAHVAPPGYYMLFPSTERRASTARFIQVSRTPTPPPVGVITIACIRRDGSGGGSVSFGTSTAAAKYSWVFPGGIPATSVAKTPGNVTFATPRLLCRLPDRHRRQRN